MSKRFRKLSHTLYECKYHLVFCPKYRYRIFQEEIAQYTTKLVHQLLGPQRRDRSLGIECSSRSHPHGGVDSAQVCRLRGDGVLKREVGFEVVPALRAIRAAILGATSVGTGLLCEHGGVE